MDFFNFLTSPDINQGLQEFHSTTGALLLDVRTAQEFRQGHIPGSRNIPLQSVDQVSDVTDDYDTPIFVYCHSGVRSRQAVQFLESMGYTCVKNLGGIIAYSGKVEC